MGWKTFTFSTFHLLGFSHTTTTSTSCNDFVGQFFCVSFLFSLFFLFARFSTDFQIPIQFSLKCHA